ncbi:MAG TPA: hypothetical protein VER36_07490 [Flavisolibacter sp.]|nr:hypothetical protein [Flavisolibacter sp.]
MKRVLLQFENILELIEFIAAINNLNCDIDSNALTIFCDLSEMEIELAINGYGAAVIEAAR